MIIPRKEDANHKSQMFMLLREILGNRLLATGLRFKGGTYAALRGLLDRFSVDLDFDLPDNSQKDEIRDECYGIFKKLGFEIKDQSKKHLQFFLKYEAAGQHRNTLKLEINDKPSRFNEYEQVCLDEIAMYCTGQTSETLFANKLVAVTERARNSGRIAGRDIYDIFVFFAKGLGVNTGVVEDRTGKGYLEYLVDLQGFIREKVSSKLLMQDLNPLIKKSKLGAIRDHLKDDLIIMIGDEIKRVESSSS